MFKLLLVSWLPTTGSTVYTGLRLDAWLTLQVVMLHE